jgi:transposase-like protein
MGGGIPPKLKGIVEVDETYIGGKPRIKGPMNKRGRGTDKAPVLALVERDGNVISGPVANISGETLRGEIRRVVDKDSTIITDEYAAYTGIGKEFKGGHKVVNHGKREYVRGDIYTNTVESYFALYKELVKRVA